ncbi:hypothetical protein V8E54_009972 [Elaphomyces granulatus]
MKLLGFAYLAALLGVSSASQIQITYYSSSDCSQDTVASHVDVTWASAQGSGDNCYDYNYGKSLEITDCSALPLCQCTFYFEPGCQGGGGHPIGLFNYYCLPESSIYNSFACYYNVTPT